MRSRRVAGGVALAFMLGLSLSPAAYAHHGLVAYSDKALVLRNAVVTSFVWDNPHSYLMFETRDGQGTVVKWVAETGSPSAMMLLDWHRNVLKPGDVITIYLNQSKKGDPIGRLNRIVLASGKELRDSRYAASREGK